MNFYRLADMESNLKTVDKTLWKKIRLRIQGLWKQALTEIRSKGGTRAKQAAFPLEISPVLRPLLSKRQLENDGCPCFSSYYLYSAHFAAIAC